MNSRERWQAAMNNQPVDRVPFGFWHHFVFEKDQFSSQTNPAILEKIKEEHINYFNEVQPDVMKIMNEGFFDYPPIMNNPLKTGEDLKKIKALGPNHPWIVDQVAHVKSISSAFKDQVFCYYNVFAPLQVIRIRFDFLDYDFQAFTHLADNFPEEFKEAGLEIQKDIDALVQQLFDADAIDGIYYCVQNIQSENYQNQDYYEKIVSPTEKVVLEHANQRSDQNILHICGYAHHKNNLHFYEDYEAKIYNWATHTENISLEEGKRIFKGKAILGGFDNNEDAIIATANDKELSAETKSILQKNTFNGFMLGADCSLPKGFDNRRLLVIKENIKETK